MRIKSLWLVLITGAIMGVTLMLANNGRDTAKAEGDIVEWVRRVYGDGMHNAWPDIAWWQGNYYVVFSHGKRHSTESVGWVLRSANLRDWEHIYTTSSPGVDCKLLALPDRLMYYYLYWDGDYVETRVVYTEDGQSWSEPQRVYEPGENFWRPKVHTVVSFIDGFIYAASDNTERVDLLRSADGLTWENVSTIIKGNGGKVTETEIVFRPDGELWALTRQNILSRARPPYLDWTNEPTLPAPSSGVIGGPAMIRIGNDIYAAGRHPGLPDKDGKGQSATSVWKYDEGAGRFEWIAHLPEAAHADTGYPGFVATEEGVYIVYYSGHAYTDDEAYAVKADIYLAKLNIDRGDIRP